MDNLCHPTFATNWFIHAIISSAIQQAGYASGHKTGEIGGDHGSEDDGGQVGGALRRHRRQRPQNDADGTQVGEAAEGVRRDHFRSMVEEKRRQRQVGPADDDLTSVKCRSFPDIIQSDVAE